MLISGIEVVEAITDPNESLNKFYDIEKSVLNVHAPLKQKRIKRAEQPNWLNQEIMDLMYERDKAHKDGNFERYKILRNKVICMIKYNKKKYLNEAIHDKKNSKALWKNLNDITNIIKADDMTLPQKIIKPDSVNEGNLNITNELNKHFVNISHIVDKENFSINNFSTLGKILNEKLGKNRFTISFITVHQVQIIIRKLDSNKATGLDGLGAKNIKAM